MSSRHFALALPAVIAIASLASVPIAGQSALPTPSTVAARPTVPNPESARQATVNPTKPTTKAAWKAPRTPWGDPDLQGTWTSDLEQAVPFERLDAFAEKTVLEGDELAEALEQQAQARAEAAPLAGGITGAGPIHWYENWRAKSNRTSMVIDPPDGKIPPLTAEAQKKNAALAAERAKSGRGLADSWEDRSLADRCISRGLPRFPGIYNNNVEIVQGPGYVVMTHEMIHEARVIPLDGRPHLSQSVRQYLGDSRGRWEGDTLVVDATNFTDKTNYRGSRETLHLVERFSRPDARTLRYEVTIDDPHTFTRPWTAALNLTPQSQIFEYACHEGNLGLRNILSGARADERAAAAAKQRKN